MPPAIPYKAIKTIHEDLESLLGIMVRNRSLALTGLMFFVLLIMMPLLIRRAIIAPTDALEDMHNTLHRYTDDLDMTYKELGTQNEIMKDTKEQLGRYDIHWDCYSRNVNNPRTARGDQTLFRFGLDIRFDRRSCCCPAMDFDPD